MSPRRFAVDGVFVRRILPKAVYGLPTAGGGLCNLAAGCTNETVPGDETRT